MKNQKINAPSSNPVKYPDKIQNRFLDRSILLRETGGSAAIKKIVLFVSLILVGFIFWANYLELDEVASTSGEMIHQGDAVKVQHLIGGRVKKVFVQNGSFVKEGQTLIHLDPVVSRLELESIQVRKQLLSVTKIRLEALLSGKEPDFSKIKDIVVVNTQIQLYQNIKKSIELERKAIINQISQVETDILLQKNTQARLKETFALIEEELNIENKLKAKGLTSRVNVLQLEKKYTDALYSLKQAPTNIKGSNARLKELRNTLLNISAKSMEAYSKELTDVNSEITIIVKKINIFDSNIDALDIKAPVDGVVHDIQLQSPGEVARPGDILLTLIPTEKPLIAKVKISSRDIGHVKNGQHAILRITTYDSRRYGVLKGELVKISPSAFIPDDRTEPYYEGIIKLNKNQAIPLSRTPHIVISDLIWDSETPLCPPDSSTSTEMEIALKTCIKSKLSSSKWVAKNQTGNLSREMKLFSGMTLTADIKTGSKTLFEYLLKPIYVARKSAFHER